MSTKFEHESVGRLARAIELSDGFSLCIVFGASQDANGYVAKEVGGAARALGTPVVLAYPSGLPQVKMRSGEERMVQVLDYTDGTRVAEVDFRALNGQRDTMRACKQLLLVILLPLGSRAVLAEQAPDLWSVRSVTIVLARGGDVQARSRLLDQWRARCRAGFDALVTENPGGSERYRHGVYTFAYSLDSPLPQWSLSQLKNEMAKASGLTGWRPWWVPHNKHPPRAVATSTLECWMASQDDVFQDPAHSDFWRASSEGKFYLLRGYDEDSVPELRDPGTMFSRGLPLWRGGEALHHAAQMAERFEADSSPIHVSASWEGLSGRRTTRWPDTDWQWQPADSATAVVDQVTAAVVTDCEEIERSLSTVVRRLTRPLGDAFLEDLDDAYVEDQINKLRSRASS